MSELLHVTDANYQAEVLDAKGVVVVDFWAPWCKNCIAMEKEVLNTPEVKKAMQNYIFVKFNAADISDKRIEALLAKCKIPGLPGYVVAVPPDAR